MQGDSFFIMFFQSQPLDLVAIGMFSLFGVFIHESEDQVFGLL